ncbi:hypothetical protein GOBAR_AA10571 [Gossypium barbadense]|uniref:Uncharacterized protein n=1 Tax=Gossypium barbadense TaxID=3634 RepID=A0A2P5Y396_GOSBA|nr:hypothetical protein GOBAR_AA10571 [Gossypium barbadense]
MELVDDEDAETMVALYYPTPLGEEDGAQEPCMVVSISYVDSPSTIHEIDIDLNAAPESDVVGDDAYHSSDPSDHEVDNVPTIKVSVLIAEMQTRFQYRVSYRKAWIAKQMAMEQLYRDFDASYNQLQRWIVAMKERFQILHYPCAHVVAACAKVSLNVEQFIDEVSTLEHTLRVWENEFPVLSNLSTWEVPPTAFELVPDKGLHRNPKGRLQSSRIHNEMDIREKSDEKLCGVCRLVDQNRSKCPLQNYHVGQSSQSDRN